VFHPFPPNIGISAAVALPPQRCIGHTAQQGAKELGLGAELIPPKKNNFISHWIGLRENLQQTMVFTIKYRAFL